jgi:hypothetical protein
MYEHAWESSSYYRGIFWPSFWKIPRIMVASLGATYITWYLTQF